jgi:hypothetical protein
VAIRVADLATDHDCDADAGGTPALKAGLGPPAIVETLQPSDGGHLDAGRLEEVLARPADASAGVHIDGDSRVGATSRDWVGRAHA